jgi:hypothetical protein
MRMCKFNINHRLTPDIIVGSSLNPETILK